jgi:nucleotide-binding universal stress UspA family protein
MRLAMEAIIAAPGAGRVAGPQALRPCRAENRRTEGEITMKVLLAVDGSDYTKRMLAYLAAHADLLGPGHEYTAMTVLTPIPPHAARHIARETLDDYYRDEAAKVLQPVAEIASQRGWKLATLHRQGHAAEEISAFADREGFDLIVMGTHGHSALGKLVLGSIAAGVLANTSSPVLLVP